MMSVPPMKNSVRLLKILILPAESRMKPSYQGRSGRCGVDSKSGDDLIGFPGSGGKAPILFSANEDSSELYSWDFGSLGQNPGFNDDDDRWMDGWKEGRMEGRMDGCMDRWMDAWMDGRGGWTGGWIDGWTDGWMDEWMECRRRSFRRRGITGDRC